MKKKAKAQKKELQKAEPKEAEKTRIEPTEPSGTAQPITQPEKHIAPAEERTPAESAHAASAAVVGERAASAKDKRDQGSALKIFALVALLAAAIFLAYYFFTIGERVFLTGSEVDAETFKGIFLDSENIYIVMDVRGAGNGGNVLQCGVDFAASSGMGGKSVTPLSMSDEGCVAPDGSHSFKECFAMLKDGVTIYVMDGPGGAKYYTNGMVVTVGDQYAVGTCGISRT